MPREVVTISAQPSFQAHVPTRTRRHGSARTCNAVVSGICGSPEPAVMLVHTCSCYMLCIRRNPLPPCAAHFMYIFAFPRPRMPPAEPCETGEPFCRMLYCCTYRPRHTALWVIVGAHEIGLEPLTQPSLHVIRALPPSIECPLPRGPSDAIETSILDGSRARMALIMIICRQKTTHSIVPRLSAERACRDSVAPQNDRDSLPHLTTPSHMYNRKATLRMARVVPSRCAAFVECHSSSRVPSILIATRARIVSESRSLAEIAVMQPQSGKCSRADGPVHRCPSCRNSMRVPCSNPMETTSWLCLPSS